MPTEDLFSYVTVDTSTRLIHDCYVKCKLRYGQYSKLRLHSASWFRDYPQQPILKAEVELILLLVPIEQLPCMLPQSRSHFLASLFLQVARHLGQRRVQLLLRRCRRSPNLLGRSNSPASQQPRTPAGHFCTFDQFCHQSWSLPCNLWHQTLQTGSLEQSRSCETASVFLSPTRLSFKLCSSFSLSPP